MIMNRFNTGTTKTELKKEQEITHVISGGQEAYRFNGNIFPSPKAIDRYAKLKGITVTNIFWEKLDYFRKRMMSQGFVFISDDDEYWNDVIEYLIEKKEIIKTKDPESRIVCRIRYEFKS